MLEAESRSNVNDAMMISPMNKVPAVFMRELQYTYEEAEARSSFLTLRQVRTAHVRMCARSSLIQVVQFVVCVVTAFESQVRPLWRITLDFQHSRGVDWGCNGSLRAAKFSAPVFDCCYCTPL